MSEVCVLLDQHRSRRARPARGMAAVDFEFHDLAPSSVATYLAEPAELVVHRLVGEGEQERVVVGLVTVRVADIRSLGGVGPLMNQSGLANAMASPSAALFSSPRVPTLLGPRHYFLPSVLQGSPKDAYPVDQA